MPLPLPGFRNIYYQDIQTFSNYRKLIDIPFVDTTLESMITDICNTIVNDYTFRNGIELSLSNASSSGPNIETIDYKVYNYYFYHENIHIAFHKDYKTDTKIVVEKDFKKLSPISSYVSLTIKIPLPPAINKIIFDLITTMYKEVIVSNEQKL